VLLVWVLIACAPVAFAASLVDGNGRDEPTLPVVGRFEFLAHLIPPPPNAHAVATGTAFFIESVGGRPRLLTAAHVVFSCLRIDILSDTMPVTHPELIAADPETDLAILRLPASPPDQERRSITALAFLPLDAPPPGPGATLTLIGYPRGGTLSRADLSRVTNITTITPRPNNPKAIVLVQGMGAHGDSGAPLLNDRGQVVGVFQGVVVDMAQATHLMGAPIEHVGFARAPLAISYFFQRYPVDGMPVSPGAQNVTPEHLRLAVVRVICWREGLSR
jgi:S1-C subfamily serine protease